MQCLPRLLMSDLTGGVFCAQQFINAVAYCHEHNVAHR